MKEFRTTFDRLGSKAVRTNVFMLIAFVGILVAQCITHLGGFFRSPLFVVLFKFAYDCTYSSSLES